MDCRARRPFHHRRNVNYTESVGGLFVDHLDRVAWQNATVEGRGMRKRKVDDGLALETDDLHSNAGVAAALVLAHFVK